MSKLLRLLTPLLAVVCIAGCSSDSDDDEAIDRDYPSIHIEAAESTGTARDVGMPVTGLHFQIINRPVVPQGNFMGTKVYEVGPPELRREVLLVQVDTTAAAGLYRLAGQAQGKRLFLLVGDKPVGVHVIEESLRSGDIFFNIEVPGVTPEERHKAIFALESKLNEIILKIRKKKEQK